MYSTVSVEGFEMAEKRSNHTVSNLNYHFVWCGQSEIDCLQTGDLQCPKYRHAILDPIENSLEASFRDVCDKYGYEILLLHISLLNRCSTGSGATEYQANSGYWPTSVRFRYRARHSPRRLRHRCQRRRRLVRHQGPVARQCSEQARTPGFQHRHQSDRRFYSR